MENILLNSLSDSEASALPVGILTATLVSERQEDLLTSAKDTNTTHHMDDSDDKRKPAIPLIMFYNLIEESDN